MKIELPESNYLSAKDFEIGDQISITILDEGVIEKSKKFGNDQYSFKVLVNSTKQEKQFTPLIQQLKKMIDIFGEDSKNWKDKTLTLLVIPNDKTASGKSFVIK